MNGGEVEETVVHADLRRDACEFARPVCDVISLLATRKTKMRLMSFLETRICLAGHTCRIGQAFRQATPGLNRSKDRALAPPFPRSVRVIRSDIHGISNIETGERIWLFL